MVRSLPLFLLCVLVLVSLPTTKALAGNATATTRRLLNTEPKHRPKPRRRAFGFVKKAVKKGVKFVKNPVNGIKDGIKKRVDCIKHPLQCIKNVGNNVKDTVVDHANGAVDCVRNPQDCVENGKDDVLDVAGDVGGVLLDCVKEPLKCAAKNPFWELLPQCIVDQKLEECFEFIDMGTVEDIGNYAANLQKIASMAFYSVGGSLYRVAKEANDRRKDDCDDSHSGNIEFPIGFKFDKKFPFVKKRMMSLPMCQMPHEWLMDVVDVFRECFLADLNSLGPKAVAIWKGGDVGDIGTCEPDDNFAIVLKLKLMVDTKYYYASAGGGIGLAFGCEDGVLRQEMIFDYEAGFRLNIKPSPVSISLHSEVGFLDVWPTHKSKFFADIGNIRLSIGIPAPAHMITAAALNLACKKTLPPAVRDIMCGYAIPHTVTMFVDPPKVNLKPDEALFEGFNMVGMSVGWIMQLHDIASKPLSAGASLTKSGSFALTSVQAAEKPKTSMKDLLKPSVGLHYGNTHIFGSLPDQQPCKGWPGYDDCQEHACLNSAICVDGVNAYTCKCVQGFVGEFCEKNVDNCIDGPHMVEGRCKHGGTCTDDANDASLAFDTYACTCVGGYEGEHCEIEVDECAVTPCQHGGTCLDEVNGYTCSCVDGYAGKDCDIDVDDCIVAPCQHGGTCLDAVNGYTCSCVDGYAGTDCEIDVDDCIVAPCQHGGTCLDAVNGYTCSCRDGYEGKDCDIDVDDCAANPCQNGGLCTDRVASFVCDCEATMFEGERCEVKKKKEEVEKKPKDEEETPKDDDDEIEGDKKEDTTDDASKDKEASRDKVTDEIQGDSDAGGGTVTQVEAIKEEAAAAGAGGEEIANDEGERDMESVWSQAAVFLMLTGMGVMGTALLLFGAFFLWRWACPKGQDPKKGNDEEEIVYYDNRMRDGKKSLPAAVWSSYQTDEGEVYFNNGARSTWTDPKAGLQEGGAARRRSVLQPAVVAI